jgi:hypothetical protein
MPDPDPASPLLRKSGKSEIPYVKNEVPFRIPE